MPHIQVNGTNLYYQETGTGAEVILFSHGLLMSHHMFNDQINHFKNHFRCIAYDHRGQGQSDKVSTSYTMETVYEDAVALIRELGLGAVHFVGLSTGGFTGMRLAARHPELVKSLVLMETSADAEPTENLPRYNLLKLVAQWLSPKLIVNGAAQSLFGESFRKDPTKAETLAYWKKHIGSLNRRSVALAAESVFTRLPVYEEITKITAPTLIIVGEEDIATVPAKAERIHNQIAGSQLVRLPSGGHSISVEEPQAVNQTMQGFYQSIGVL